MDSKLSIMDSQLSKVFSVLERQYINWLGSTIQTKTITCSIEGVELTIVLNQGHWIYEKDSVFPHEVKDSFNVVTVDPRIKEIFKTSLQFLNYKDYYQFRDNNVGTFRLRFFKDISAVEQKIEEENKRFEEVDKQKSDVVRSCVIL